jgi:hypothetical protein
MSTQILDEVVFVPFPIRLYRELLDRHSTRANAVIENVVEDFLDRTAESTPRTAKNRGAGMFWEALFLPEKTRLRTKHLSQYKYADVKGDKVLYDGKSFSSVAQATNKMRGNTQNNAWKVLEVLLPNDSQWVHASRLRKKGGL